MASPALALLFGSMIMTIILEREGMFGVVTRLLTRGCETARSLLTRVCVVCACLAALLNNDTVCVFITPVVGKLCNEYEHASFSK